MSREYGFKWERGRVSRTGFLWGLSLVLCASTMAEPPQSASLPRVNDGFLEPIRTIKVSAPESGVVTELPLKRGERVQAGEILAVLDQEVLEASREIAVARVESSSRREAAAIEYESKSKRLRHLLTLQRDGFGSNEEVDRARTELALAETEMKAADEQLRLDRLELARIEAQIERRRIRSPIDGVITELHQDVGEFVDANTPVVVTVVRLDELLVRFYLPAEIAGRFAADATVQIRLVETGELVKAVVEFLSPVVHAESGTVQLHLRVDNGRGRIRSGSRCRLELSAALAGKINR